MGGSSKKNKWKYFRFASMFKPFLKVKAVKKSNKHLKLAAIFYFNIKSKNSQKEYP